MAKSTKGTGGANAKPTKRASADPADGKLDKAIDRPIGQPEDAREEAPIGWDFGPDGQPPIIPGQEEGRPAESPVPASGEPIAEEGRTSTAEPDVAPRTGFADDQQGGGGAADPDDAVRGLATRPHGSGMVDTGPALRTVGPGGLPGRATPEAATPGIGHGGGGDPAPGGTNDRDKVPTDPGRQPDLSVDAPNVDVPNKAPSVSGDSTSAATEDTALVVGGRLIATDPEGGITDWTVQGNANGAYGSLTIDGTGQWTYVLDNDSPAVQGLRAGETVQEIFTVRVTDQAGATVNQQIIVTVTGTNDVPVISGAHSGAVTEDIALTVAGQLAASDVDVGDTAAWSLPDGSDGSYGSIVVDSATGQWTYQLDNDAAQGLRAGETHTDVFVVRVTDSAGATVDQQVSITVTGTNDAPVISGTHTGTVTEDSALTASGALAATDVDIGDTASWSLPAGGDGSYGSLVVDADTGQWTYQLDNDAAQGLKAGETVQEIFTVRVTDEAGATVDQQVTITLQGTNDQPVIGGTHTGAVTEDGALTAGGTLTATDVDVGDTAAWSLPNGGDGSYGSFVVDADSGQWTYQLDNDAAQGLKAGETVQEIFTVRVTDEAGATVDQQVTITVTGTNDGPVISGTHTGTVAEDAGLTASGTLTVTDVDVGDTAAWSMPNGGDGSYGSLALDAATGQWTYQLDNDAAQGLKAGETVQEIFTVRVTDEAGATVDQQVTITVTGTNDAPVISCTHTGTVAEDGGLTASGALTATDVDIGDTASWSLAGPSDGSYGSLALDAATGQWTYQLDNDAAQGLKAGETVQEIFTVRVTDEAGATVDQQVTITVTGTNDAPVISGTHTGAVAEDGGLTASGALTATDVDIGDTASWSLAGPSDGSYGSLALDAATGQWTYQLDNDAAQGLKAGETVQEIFTVRVTDEAGATVDQQITVTVTGTNDAPVIGGTHTGTVAEDGALSASGALTAADVDIGDTAAWSLPNGGDGSYGSLVVDADTGQWTYQLDNDAAQGLKAGETVQEIFTVRVTDEAGATVEQQITVTIQGTNDTPVIGGTHVGQVTEDGALAASGQLTATDVDVGDIATWSLPNGGDGSYGNLVVDATGQWTYQLDNDSAQGLKAGETAQEIFTVRVTDQAGATVEQQITVTITGTNDAPVISGTHSGTVTEDGALTAGGTLTAADVDIGDTATWSLPEGGDGSYGSLVVDAATGQWTYQLDNDTAQGFKAGETHTDVFVVRVTDQAGATVDQQVTITVTGTNDAPVISGTHTGTVTEDAGLTASSTLTAADVDVGDTAAWSLPNGGDGSYGSLVVDADTGQWTYQLDNDSAQGLRAGETVQEIFTVRVTDEAGATVDQQITITVTGTNDAPEISGTHTGRATEDGALTAGGTLTATDVDIGDTAAWSLPNGGDGSYGSLAVDAATGQWTYQLDNDAAQGLKAGETVQEIFTVRVTDEAGATVDQQVTITVTGTNDQPVISGTHTGTATEDAALTATGQLTAADVDIGDTASWSLPNGSDGAYGSLALDAATGQWTYQLDNDTAQGLKAGETVQEIFTVRVTDKAGATVEQQVTVTIQGTNNAPVISGTHTGTVTEDTALTAGGTLSAADVDIGDTASWSLPNGGDGSYGSLVVDPETGQWTYQLDNDAAQGLKAGDSVQEIFTVRVTDEAGATVDQQITITVVGTNDQPAIGGTHTGAVTEDGALSATGQLTVTDADIGGTAAWSLPNGGDGSYGSFVVDADSGQWTYQLDNDAAQGLKAGETVQEIFTVRVTDQAGATVEQQVTVTVTGTNDTPVISGTHTGTVAEDGALTASGTLTATDVDIGDTASWSLAGPSDGSYGSLALDAATGQWTYQLDNDAAQGLKAGETVQEIFTVRVTDEAGATVDQQVTITVTGTNDAPVISGTHTGTVTEDAGFTASGTLTAADVDIGDTAAWSMPNGGDGSYGSLALDAATGQWTYQLDNDSAQGLKAGETVQEIFTVRVTDEAGATVDQQIIITVTGTNDAPVISGTHTGTVAEDGTLTASGTLTAADVDIGDTAAWSLPNGGDGSYGSLVVDADTGQWTYQLDNDAAQGLKAGETVQEIFTVRVTDEAGATVDQQVTITVTGTNDTPVIGGTHTGTVTEDAGLTASGALTATDVDIGDTASWSLAGPSDGSYGSLALDAATGQWAYQLNNDAAQGLKAGETVQEIFTVRVTDQAGATVDQQVTIIVTGTNDAPVISGTHTGTVAEDAGLSASGTLTATDVDVGDTAAWSLAGPSDGSYGSLALDAATGQWTYQLDNDAAQGLRAGETVQEIFTVRVTDQAGATVDQQVTITVTGTNDTPVISGTHTGTVAEDSALSASGTLTATDVDVGDTASWSLAGPSDGNYGSLILDAATGQWTYQLDNDAAQGLNAGDTVQEIFTVKATDSQGAVAEQQITITVTGTNDGPVISGTATGSVLEDGVQVAHGQLQAVDADAGDTVTWSLQGDADGSYGSLTLDADGSWKYKLDNQAAQSLREGEVFTETFTVRATDQHGAYTEKEVTVEITGRDDKPNITGTATGAATEDVVLTASGTLVATDVDAGDTTTWSVDGQADGIYGAIAIDSQSGQWTYTLDNATAQSLKAGEVVRETFTVQATDAAGGQTSQVISVDITGTNDAPIVGQALNSMGSMKEDTSFTFTVDDLLNGAQISDIDRDALTVTNVALDPSNPPGTLVDNHDGSWTYTPGTNVSNVSPQVVFSVSDGHQTVSAHASMAIEPVADPANVEITAGVMRDVINTGAADDLGRIVVSNLTTTRLAEFTLEFTVLGKSVPESTTGQGPVIVNIGSSTDKNALTLWDPANLKVGMSKSTGGDVNIPTGINLTDGESHRVTVTWDGKNLKIYDNGDLALTTQPPKAWPSAMYMAIAEKANTPPTTSNPNGGGYRDTEHFEGTIFNVAMANKAETATQVENGPLAEQLKSNLLIDVRAEDGKIVDTTGKHTIRVAGGLHDDTLPVDSSLASVPAGSTLHLDVSSQLGDPNDTVTHLEIGGFLAGTVLSDGVHTVTVAGQGDKVDITNWSLGNLTANLPDGVRANMDLTVSATVTTPPHDTGQVDANGQPILTSDTYTTVEDHQVYVEGATVAAAQTVAATAMRAFFAAPSATPVETQTDDTAASVDHASTTSTTDNHDTQATDSQSTTEHTASAQPDGEQTASVDPTDGPTVAGAALDDQSTADHEAATSLAAGEDVAPGMADAGAGSQASATVEADHAASEPSSSTADAYLAMVQPQDDAQAAAPQPAVEQTSSAGDYVQMVAETNQTAQEPPTPDHLFADSHIENGAASGPDAPDGASGGTHDDAAAAAEVPPPEPMQPEHHDQAQGGGL